MKTALLIPPVLLALPLFPASHAQTPFADPPEDPFVGTIDAMKHSIAPLVCLAVNDEDGAILSRQGTAFFVSATGDFLTAAHVLEEMQKESRRCPTTAITLPSQGWQPRAPNEPTAWFNFNISDCVIDQLLDAAVCRPVADLSRLKADARIVPVQLELNLPPDGTQVAFTGFPFGVRDPMTFRAAIAANKPAWLDGKAVDELVLDRVAWPGFSGSPVFRSDGRVLGILIKGNLEDGAALTLLRPISALRPILAERAKK